MRTYATLLSTVACLAACPALAQEQTSPVTTNAAVDGQSNTAAAQASPTGELGAGDIVVTATRRAERLADVPISINAVNQESLQNSGATDIRGVAQLAPSLSVSSTGSEANASARIRGIGTVGDNPGLESSVVTFIDGVYRSRTGSGLNDIGEIERVEVLRGPQGTLSGRNSSAGAINIYTKAPSFDFGGYGEATYGNYDAVRVAGALTGPIVKDLLAFRVDGVYAKRDGFYRDVINNTDFNDRNRYFVRGQLLLEPSSDFSVRLIGDYTRRDEKCCGAVYVDLREKIDPTPGTPGDFAINPAGNRIVQVMQSLGAVFPSAGDPYNRRIAQTPGRAYSNITKDYGGSAQVDWNFGGAALTSITAYREYKSFGAGDFDYGNLDLVYRRDDGNAFRRFRTFTQELRLNGEAFGDRLNWLVGGFYSNEKLRVADNTRFGTDYGRFAACRVIATANPTAALRNPNAPGCLGTTAIPGLGVSGRTAVLGTLVQQQTAAGTALAVAAQNANTVLGGIDALSTISDRGAIRDNYDQKSESFAFFTHNVFKITDTLSLTGGLRWTKETKSLDASFTNDNTVCASQLGNLAPLLANPQLASTVAGILTLSCTGNSSATLNGKTLSDKFSNDEFTGTAVLSWKPIDRLMTYASYSRGFKAGGFNLDKSDLGLAYLPQTTLAPNVNNLRFDPETVNAYEIGLKYSSRPFTFNLAAFRSDFTNFQLNTFNGTNFIVQNLSSCDDGLNGADKDNSAATGRCTSGVGTGVRSQGVELEAGFYPARSVAITMGYTLADTKVRRNIVGSASGEPLDPALFLLPGAQMPLAPRNVITTSASWTPEIGSNGMSALFYIDQRTSSDYNTGSDNFPEKEQDGFTVVNARVGLHGRDDLWAIEVWAQNLLNQDYQQVAFNAPFQGAGSQAQVQAFGAAGGFATANQVFTSYLAEPRTYGLTVRTRF